MQNQVLMIKELLEKSKNVALFGHINPDGDCIGSMLGFGRLLEKQGKTVKYFTPTKPSRIYSFVENIEKISDEFDYGDYDVLLFLDFSDITRIKNFVVGHEEYFDNNKIVSIDHHINQGVPKSWLINTDPDAMSACEIIFELTYPRWPDLYDSQVATCFYLGLTTDSGNFRYDEDHERILDNALKLVRLGADKKMVVNNSFRKKSLRGVEMMALAFSRIRQKGGLIYSRYTEEDLKKFDLDSEEANFAQIIIQDIQEAVVTCIFKIDGETLNGSLRSQNYDVQKVAKLFGGGGHIHASGFKIPREGLIEDQIEKIAQQISDYII